MMNKSKPSAISKEGKQLIQKEVGGGGKAEKCEQIMQTQEKSERSVQQREVHRRGRKYRSQDTVGRMVRGHKNRDN